MKAMCLTIQKVIYLNSINISEETEESEPCPSDYESDEDEPIPPLPYQYSQGFHTGFHDLNVEGTGMDEDYMPVDHFHEDEMRFWNEKANELCSNMYFTCKKQVDHAVRLWNVAQNQEIFMENSRPDVY
ncbi:hypothetical protein L1987_06834 [Smallanthus sonchifolius]|uniref:Uncharacterized protein n=1 Tax=Smallanthus sonchifolius TaxID=185202 RepID=A0ACB9JZ80_9ASTR|nr:hypothetical protein L1987_06834 [Smallanthus sonchifolius]